MSEDRAPASLRDFALRYTAAWCNRDAARMAAFFSANGSLSINGGAPAAGRRAIADAAQAYMTAFPDLHLQMDDVVMQGEQAVYHWTFSGTNTGPGGTGRRVCFSGYEVWRFGDDGLIAKSQGHYDSADYQRQLEQHTEESVF